MEIHFRRNYPLLLRRGFFANMYSLDTYWGGYQCKIQVQTRWFLNTAILLLGLTFKVGLHDAGFEKLKWYLRKPFKYCLAWWGCTPMADKIRQTLFERLPKGRFWKNTKEMTLASLLKNMFKLLGYWGLCKTAGTPLKNLFFCQLPVDWRPKHAKFKLWKQC